MTYVTLEFDEQHSYLNGEYCIDGDDIEAGVDKLVDSFGIDREHLAYWSES